ncbi:MAG: ParB N-terminal domain-containing protein [Cyanobacteria bacterium CAN_BIN43]|nr:ParB N-terminal domain-containing protein [Cyanobacteria bacterium CAN_BIN43]
MADLKSLVQKMQAAKGDAIAPESPVISESTIPLNSIKERSGGDTRPLNQKHAEALAENIGAIGLIEPLVLDNQKRLLAGGHRLAALHLLRQNNEPAFNDQFPNGNVPVRLLPFDSEQDTELALQIEVAENEQRRDYTPAEVRAVADKLKEAGYRTSAGRPKKGEKALAPVLSLIFGKSLRTVERYLAVNEKIPTRVGISSKTYLKKALSSLQQWQKVDPESEQEKLLSKNLPAIVKVIEQILKDSEEQ